MLEDEPQRIVDLRRQMVRMELDRLVSGRDHGVWVSAFECVPRHVFLPRIRSLTEGTVLAGTEDWGLEHIYSGMLVGLPDFMMPFEGCRTATGIKVLPLWCR